MTVWTFVQPQDETAAAIVPPQTVAWGMQDRRPLNLFVSYRADAKFGKTWNGYVLLVIADSGGGTLICCCCRERVSDRALCETLMHEPKNDRREEKHLVCV